MMSALPEDSSANSGGLGGMQFDLGPSTKIFIQSKNDFPSSCTALRVLRPTRVHYSTPHETRN